LNPGETKTFNLDDVVLDLDNRDNELLWSVLWTSQSETLTGVSIRIDQTTRVVSVKATPTAPLGIFTARFTVTDPQRHTASGDLTIRVKARPKVTLPDTIFFTADTDVLLSLDDYVTDDGPDSTITWSISESSQIYVLLDPTTRVAILRAVEEQATQDTVRFTATDPDNYRDSATVRVIVSGVQRPLTIDLPVKIGLPAGVRHTITLDDYVKNPDVERSTLVWNVSQTLFLQVTVDNATRQATITAPGSFIGFERVTFTAFDPGGGVGQDSLLIFSAPLDGTPVAGGIPNLTVVGNDSVTIDLDEFYFDIENHDDREMRWSVFFPFGESMISVTIDQVTHVATIRKRPGGSAKPAGAAQTSKETIFFVVTDPNGRSATFQSEVTLLAQPLTLSRIPDVTLLVGQADSLRLDSFVTSEFSSSVIMWRISRTVNIPVFFDEKTHVAIFQSVGGWKGKETVVFTATDPLGNSDSDTIAVTVREPIGSPPIIAPLPVMTLRPGLPDSIALDGYVRDPDGTDDAIRWRITPPDTAVRVELDPLSRQLRLLTFLTTPGDKRILLTATDLDLNSSRATLTVRVVSDTTGPGLTAAMLRNPILTSFLTIYIVTDEGLKKIPEVWLRQTRLTVTPVDSSFKRFAVDYRLTGDGGTLVFRVIGEDSAGNVTEKEKTVAFQKVSKVSGGVGASPDRRLKVVVPGDGTEGEHLLLISEEVGDDGRTVYTVDTSVEEVELQAVSDGQGDAMMFRQEGGIWRPIATSVDRERGLLIATGERSGVFSVLRGKGEAVMAELPAAYELAQNAPNPFNTETTIMYRLPIGGAVSLTIYNLSGQQARKLIDSYQGSGEHRVVWDGRDDRGRSIATGVYFYRLTAGEFTAVRRMILVK
ncbi:MAG: T9SS type A sorting domain-containing protein, partial [Candidatus Latescibacteria bacterium]|nr:T9SS type A sorting domain-containing protein [Candidatus Latescibacterota bacterium]